MREIIVYTLAGLGVLTVLGFSVHMFVGGMVSAETERGLIIGACSIGALVIGAMAMDVIKRRRHEQ
ncbi:MAG: hypothetical protein OEW08_01370 [Gammaproteobacteria bacterium]|nr:hypothetical protein [Gammaproteobacteria bacterium]